MDIPKEKFRFITADVREKLSAELESASHPAKSRGYFYDAMLRFRKNKSSVVAAFIIAALVLFAILAPIVSPYTIANKDSVYAGYPPYAEGVPFLDGGVTYESQTAAQLAYWEAIGEETGMNPIIRILDEKITTISHRGEQRETISYKLRTNKYYEIGVIYRVLSIEEFERIQRFQNESGLQVIYPYVDAEASGGDANVWYRTNADGSRSPAYLTDSSLEGAPYDSLRVSGDDGSFIYSVKKSGAVQCRVCYYNYYIYRNGRAPMYLFGTNATGQDLFMAIGVGARFSLLFALIVSAINLTIGMIYGAIQGYYGGTVDLVMDRVADVLSGLPFIVVATLFSLHLSQKVGVVPSFLFAFVLTGWIATAALTRKQFYRYKGQEFVLAARTLGASDRRLMARHVFPNAIGTIITGSALVIPGVISSETALTYLGIINLQEFAGTSIGTLMAQGQTSMTTSPHAMLFPALFFSLLLISFNLFGNGLRDAFNPSTMGVED